MTRARRCYMLGAQLLDLDRVQYPGHVLGQSVISISISKTMSDSLSELTRSAWLNRGSFAVGKPQTFLVLAAKIAPSNFKNADGTAKIELQLTFAEMLPNTSVNYQVSLMAKVDKDAMTRAARAHHGREDVKTADLVGAYVTLGLVQEKASGGNYENRLRVLEVSWPGKPVAPAQPTQPAVPAASPAPAPAQAVDEWRPSPLETLVKLQATLASRTALPNNGAAIFASMARHIKHYGIAVLPSVTLDDLREQVAAVITAANAPAPADDDVPF